MGLVKYLLSSLVVLLLVFGCETPKEEVAIEPEKPQRHQLRGWHPFSEWELCVVEHSWDWAGFSKPYQDLDIEHFYDEEHMLQYHSVLLGDSIYNLFFHFYDDTAPRKVFSEQYRYSEKVRRQIALGPQSITLDTMNSREVRTLKNLLSHYSKIHNDYTAGEQVYQLASLLIEVYQKRFYQSTMPMFRLVENPAALMQMHECPCLADPDFVPSEPPKKWNHLSDAWLVFEIDHGIIVFELDLPNYTNILRNLRVHVYPYRCMESHYRWCGVLSTPTECYGLEK